MYCCSCDAHRLWGPEEGSQSPATAKEHCYYAVAALITHGFVSNELQLTAYTSMDLMHRLTHLHAV